MYLSREKFKINTKNNTNLPKNQVNSINLILHVGRESCILRTYIFHCFFF